MEQKLYICYDRNTIIMDIQLRKYNFIQQLVDVQKESTIDALERVLKQEKEEHQEISTAHKKELDKRLKSYQENPDNVLDWKAVKNDW